MLALNQAARSKGKPPGSKPARRVRTPLLIQAHATECGAACLGSVLAYFGRWVPLSELRDRCGVSRDGSTAAGISRAAGDYGLVCRGRNVNTKHLREMPMPQIVFWEWNHFLILEGFDKNRAYLNDPAVGRRSIPLGEFAQKFSGVALHFSIGPEFTRGGVYPSIARHIRPWFRGVWGDLSRALLCGLAMALLGLAAPVALGLFVDRILGQNDSPGGLAAVVAVAAVLVYALSWLRSRFLSRVSARVSITAADHHLSRLLRLPLRYFSHRLTGDLTGRILSIDQIAKSLPNFVDLLIEIALSAVFLAAIFAYDVTLALIVLGLMAGNMLVTRAVARIRTEENHALRQEQGLMAGLGMLMLRRTDTLRMTGADDGFFSRWGGHQARELAARQRFMKWGHINAALPVLFMTLTHAALLAVGAGKVMAGELTVGALAATYFLATLALMPVGRFVEFANERQALEAALQRIEDIARTEKDARFKRRAAADTTATLNGKLRLAGHVELRDVTFGHDAGRPPLIRNLNLVIRPGQRVALVGGSGSGKSTLASIVAGAFDPWSGEVLFDHRPRREIPDEVMVRSLSVVDQNPVLFSATIRENITLWNSAVPDNVLVDAARDAQIHDRILDRPRGYEALVDEDGSNFSGGERQRLEIARALVGGPTVLILDEATSALDTITEKTVDDALRRRGVSCLIVAHRLSTIRDCDQIIVLDRGVELQRGTHDELMRDRDGLYRRLVQSG